MAKQATNLRETTEYVTNHKSDRDKTKARRRAVRRSRRETRQAMDGKVFADLTSEEKDTLLKALAIQAGLLKE